MKPVAVMIAAPIHAIPPRLGAAVEWWMWQVSRRLQGWTPHIICTWAEGYARDEVQDGVGIHRIHLGRAYKRLFQKLTRLDPWGYSQRAAVHIDKLQAALVHVHNDPELYRRLRDGARDRHRRHLLHLHNERSDLHGLEHAELVVVSEYLADWYRQRLPHARVSVVTNGVDLEQFCGIRATPEERAQVLAGLAPAVKRVVLYAGRISPEKGPLHLVHAMTRVMAIRSDVALVLVGEFARGRPDSRRVQYGEYVRAGLAALPMGRTLCLGSVSPDRIDKVYACADLVVMPSEFNEPLGMVALEAMAAGVPLLAARKGGLREIVREGVTGFFIPEGGDTELAQRILDLLESDAFIAEVLSNARAYVTYRHGWDSVAKRMEEVFN